MGSDTMDDDSDERDTKRKSRNLSEKKRRDQFNVLVKELSCIVSANERKMDKSTVLKSTISYLKNHKEFVVRTRGNGAETNWKPTFLNYEEFTHLVLEAVDGFIIVFSTTGHIYYVSENITSLLGYLSNDILSMTIHELVTDEEYSDLCKLLVRSSKEGINVSITCHLRRRLKFQERTCHELVHFVGDFKFNKEEMHMDNELHGNSRIPDKSLVFIGTGKLQTPMLLKEMLLVDSRKPEFISRHSFEWKFLFLDHRAPAIIGYLPFELLGTSGYEYYHMDDIEKLVRCHQSLMRKGEGTSCCYRFLTKGQQWIWLQTRFYITYHQWNSKPEFIVCTHRVISYHDVVIQKKHDYMEPDQSSSEAESTVVQHLYYQPRPISKEEPDCTCTSMSADSPTSRLSDITQSMSTDIPSVTSTQYEVQADLQRKQVQLKAIIDRQQQELKRVSEQLFMARLGILHQHQQPTSPQSPKISSGTVSSTTAPISSVSSALIGSSSVIVQTSAFSKKPIILYKTPNSNTLKKQ
ncbi:neuronal PAS domain-containing protein 2 isoform X2 [Sitophilus oryzae]|uniref:Neuronal PAS domain-containing protein 2 isoform X2 n=1 Tax=Sitophilus oryzae TaxID=7048 RepID=A0A6J2YIA6_SITOR|nr:neuronal PAS domain-containing protein 2 isoform X2 [Sitophilus oryzae]